MSGTQAVLAIEGELTIYRAAELCEELKAVLASAPALEINLSVSVRSVAGSRSFFCAARVASAASGLESVRKCESRFAMAK